MFFFPSFSHRYYSFVFRSYSGVLLRFLVGLSLSLSPSVSVSHSFFVCLFAVVLSLLLCFFFSLSSLLQIFSLFYFVDSLACYLYLSRTLYHSLQSESVECMSSFVCAFRWCSHTTEDLFCKWTHRFRMNAEHTIYRDWLNALRSFREWNGSVYGMALCKC